MKFKISHSLLMSVSVKLRCVKEGSRLRVKILSQGYSPHANCQFPKNIRLEGREYSVPANDISLCDTRGKFFYRVKKQNIIILDSDLNNVDLKDNLKELKIYGDDDMTECNICMNDTTLKPDIIFVILAPCGHYCICKDCSSKIKECPMCRSNIAQIVTRDQLQ